MAQKPIRHVKCMYPRAECCKGVSKAYRYTRTRQNTSKRLYNAKLTWCKPRIVPRGATGAREPHGCIRRMHACVVHSNRRGNGCKNRQRRQQDPNKPKLPNSPIGTESWCRGKADGSRNHADGLTTLINVQSSGTNPKTAENASRKVRTH